jgi:hypothetical protein
MNKNKKVLFVVSNPFDTIGGHKISAITLAKTFSNLGYEVGLLISPPLIDIPDLKNINFQVHYCKVPMGRNSFFIRPFQIFNVVRKNQYDSIIACDLIASYHSIIAVICNKLPIVQIIAGGKAIKRYPLNIPGIVVFSEELFNNLPKLLNIPQNHFKLSQGRIDFNHLSNYPNHEDENIVFLKNYIKILIISRLPYGKFEAINAFFDQLSQVKGIFKIHCIVIGEGEAKNELIKITNDLVQDKKTNLEIDFYGAIRVTPSHLRCADLVIGQGRTVIEAIASGVAAAVSGNDGYFGLITSKNFYELSSSNMTGRGLKPYSNLNCDLEHLKYYYNDEINKVYKMAKKIYDSNEGALLVESALFEVYNFFLTKNKGQIFLLYSGIVINKLRSLLF